MSETDQGIDLRGEDTLQSLALQLQLEISSALLEKSVKASVSHKVRGNVTELLKIIVALEKQNALLTGRLKERSRSRSTHDTSYASICASAPAEPVKRFPLLFTPKDTTSTAPQAVHRLVNQALDSKSLGVSVVGSKPAGKSWLVECSTEKEIKTLADAAVKDPELAKEVEVHIPKRLKPKVLLKTGFELDEFDSIPDFADELIKANPELLPEDSLDCLFSFKNKRGYCFVFTVDPPVFRNLMAAKKLKLNFSVFGIEEFNKPKQCSGCLRYGHSKKECRSKLLLCAKCGKSGHLSKDCKNASSCINCAARTSHRPNTSCEHSAFDDKCPVRLRETELLRRRTDYI